MIARSTIAAALLAATITPLAFAGTAHAEAGQIGPVVTTDIADGGLEAASAQVRFGDLNLATAKGQAALDARLRQAARSVCGISYGAHPLSEDGSNRKCYNRALAGARQTLASAEYRKVMSR